MVLTLRKPARMVNSDSTDEFTLRLLRSANADQPSMRAVNRAMVRVTALLASDQDRVVAARVSEAVPINRSRRSHTRPDTSRITRAAGLGLLLGTSLAAAVVGVTHSRAPLKQPVVVVDPVSSASQSKRVTGFGAHAPIRKQERPVDPIEAPVTAAPVPSTPSSSSQPRETRPARAPGNDLSHELALLDAAKASLSAANPRGALRVLDEATLLTRRALVPEATVLRVKALVALNRTTEARRLVGRFATLSPNSPVNPVLRDLVAPLEKP